jgi:hypothetical protein
MPYNLRILCRSVRSGRRTLPYVHAYGFFSITIKVTVLQVRARVRIARRAGARHEY